MKPFIVLGDKTSHGGKVISACPTATTHGKPIARLGDKVTCPKCGSNTIASGDSTQIIMGKPVARHGDKTACGATLIASQQVTTDGGKSSGGQGGSAPANQSQAACVPSKRPTKEEGRSEYKYQKIYREYAFSQPAYLWVEGAGGNGTYSLTGYIRLEGTKLSINAMGGTSVTQIGDVIFSGSVTVSKQDVVYAHKNFAQEGPSDWPDNELQPIGSVTITLPEPQDKTPLTLKITGGYIYVSPAGSARPTPPETSETYTIEVAKNAVD